MAQQVKYTPAKSIVVMAIMALLLGLAVLSLFDKTFSVFLILLIVNAYLFWMWFDTSYTIDGSNLHYHSALLKGVIPISSIREVEKNKTLYAGIKASLSTKGIIIKYNKYDDIYISPANADGFIDHLKTINPNIVIK